MLNEVLEPPVLKLKLLPEEGEEEEEEERGKECFGRLSELSRRRPKWEEEGRGNMDSLSLLSFPPKWEEKEEDEEDEEGLRWLLLSSSELSFSSESRERPKEPKREER